MRWVIGDIHGMYDSLRGLLDAVSKRDGSPRFFFVGDYVNRGPASNKVIELLAGLADAAFVRGNHDDIFDFVLHGSCYDPHSAAADATAAFAWFMNHGLANTFTSYGVDLAVLQQIERRPTPQRLAEIAAAVPEHHRRFVHSLPPVVEEHDLFVAHAMWDPDEPDVAPGLVARLELSPARRHRVLWGRYDGHDIRRTKRWIRTGYFGHTPVEAYGPGVHQGRNIPIRGPDMVLLDTGAALTPGGRLTAVCAETGEIVQTNRAGAVVEGP